MPIGRTTRAARLAEPERARRVLVLANGDEAGAGGADRVAHGDARAVDVDALRVIVVADGITRRFGGLTAVNALRRLRERGGAKQLNSLLNERNPHVRAAAIRALGDLGEKDAAPRILSLLRDDSSYVRSAAAEALGKLGDRTAILPLLHVLSGEANTNDVAAGLVVGTGDKFLAELQLNQVQTKTRAVEALGVLRAPEAVEPIIDYGLKSEDAGLRAVSAHALGRIADPRAIVPLENVVRNYYVSAPTDLEAGLVINPGANKVADETRQMKEKESRVRASVAWALGQIGDASAKETLLKAMNDQNSLVRDAALEALAKISEKQEAKEILATDGKKNAPAPKPH